jgi:hypothetical protein
MSPRTSSGCVGARPAFVCRGSAVVERQERRRRCRDAGELYGLSFEISHSRAAICSLDHDSATWMAPDGTHWGLSRTDWETGDNINRLNCQLPSVLRRLLYLRFKLSTLSPFGCESAPL